MAATRPDNTQHRGRAQISGGLRAAPIKPRGQGAPQQPLGHPGAPPGPFYFYSGGGDAPASPLALPVCPPLPIGRAARPSAAGCPAEGSPPGPLTCTGSAPNRRRDEPAASRGGGRAGQSGAGRREEAGGARQPLGRAGRPPSPRLLPGWGCCCWKWRHGGGTRWKRKRPLGRAAAGA